MRTYEHECPFCGERKTRRRLEAHIDAMHPESPLPRASSCVFEGPKIKRLTTSIDKEAEVALVREQKPALFIEGTQVTKGNRTTRMFRCRLCPRKLYQRRAHVDTHVWSKHFRLKPFRCARCTGEFGQKSHLKRHLSDCHAKIKTHACCFCGSFFAQKSNLEAHILRHHSDDLKPDLDQRENARIQRRRPTKRKRHKSQFECARSPKNGRSPAISSDDLPPVFEVHMLIEVAAVASSEESDSDMCLPEPDVIEALIKKEFNID